MVCQALKSRSRLGWWPRRRTVMCGPGGWGWTLVRKRRNSIGSTQPMTPAVRAGGLVTFNCIVDAMGASNSSRRRCLIDIPTKRANHVTAQPEGFHLVVTDHDGLLLYRPPFPAAYAAASDGAVV